MEERLPEEARPEEARPEEARPEEAPLEEPPSEHYDHVRKAILHSRLIPFFGAGVNLYGRPDKSQWQPGQDDYLPNGIELAKYLAKECHDPEIPKEDLMRVSQYIAITLGDGPLYETLRKIFNGKYPLTDLHRFFASLPSVLRKITNPQALDLPKSPDYPLIVTTNYDDLLERAFEEADEKFDLVTYIATGKDQGKFLHRLPAKTADVIKDPNVYDKFSFDVRPTILKIHGAVNRSTSEDDSFVITEDNYIDYLARGEITRLLPVQLLAKLKQSHMLFLGYSLRDWNLRVILKRIWCEQRVAYKSWAIQLGPRKYDKEFWQVHNVTIFHKTLHSYIAELQRRF
jgi:hypothetical protein